MTNEDAISAMLKTMGITPPRLNTESPEARRERVMRAAEVLKCLQTPGGEVIKQQLQVLQDTAVLPPESYLRIDGKVSQIDVTQVACLAGYRQAIKDISSFLTNCDILVNEEAKRVANAEDSAPSQV